MFWLSGIPALVAAKARCCAGAIPAATPRNSAHRQAQVRPAVTGDHKATATTWLRRTATPRIAPKVADLPLSLAIPPTFPPGFRLPAWCGYAPPCQAQRERAPGEW